MNRDDLKDLAANPDFISGIYNYCDRWCERCAFNSRCFVYATEKADADLDDPDVRDLNNPKFWRKLELIFKDAHELIRDCAKEAGVDLDTIEDDDAVAAHERETDEARGHEFALLARDYAGMVQTWFTNELSTDDIFHLGAGANAGDADAEIDLPAAVEVIRWYQFFIAAKVFRALLGSDDELRDVYDHEDAAVNPAQTDANGSAKIALIAIDRSFSAWRIMQGCVPDKKDSISPMLAALEDLRNGIGQALPLARDFVRPGFDEVISELAN